MKIIFAGTPEFAAVALRALHAAGFQIPLVLTQPDRPAGRGLRLQASAVKQFAAAQGIPVAQPVSLRLDGKYPAEAQEAHQLLHRTPHDVMVVAAYGLILPPSVLQIAPLGCLNIHASLLPRWRGAAPIQRAIEAGDAETGITIMQMDAGLDTGPMLRRQAVPITLADTAGSLHDKLASLGASMIVEALQAQARGELRPEPQAQAGVTYAAKVRKEEAALDFALAAEMLAHKIQAFNPFPGATALLDGAPLKLWRAAALPLGTGGAVPGTVLAASAEGIDVACGHGVLRLTELQKAGGKRWSAAQFLQGSVLQGARFG